MYFVDSGTFVEEVSSISYSNFATRISGNVFLLPAAIIGYFLMTIRHKIMIILLPMLLFGAMSYGIPGLIPSAGLRFSFYATPVLSISLVYFIVWLSVISKSIFHKNIKFRYIAFILVLLPNIEHVVKYQPKSILKNSDIQILDNLHQSISRNDYIISWWDYGYYIRYYTGAKTVSDGGAQLGQILYPISYLFMNSSQYVSAKLALLISHEVNKHSGLNYLKMMMNTYGYKNAKLFLKDLEEERIEIKKDNFETYIYIPSQMLNLYGTIDQFSKIDLKTGKPIDDNKYFYISSKPVIFKNENMIPLGKGIIYVKDKQEVYFQTYTSSVKIKKILTINYDKNTKIRITTKHTGNTTGYIMIKLDDGKVILADDLVFNSTLIQLGVLEKYNTNYYEAINLSPNAKVYRIKK
jgi:hypothetical protein